MTDIKAEMESQINDVCFESGAHVSAGDTILRLDCMKMLIAVLAPIDGYVYYTIQLGDYVQEGMLLARIDDK